MVRTSRTVFHSRPGVLVRHMAEGTVDNNGSIEATQECGQRRSLLCMASIRMRSRKDGSKSYMVRWRDPKSHKEQGLTVATCIEAEHLPSNMRETVDDGERCARTSTRRRPAG